MEVKGYKYRVLFRVKRNNQPTAALRKRKPNDRVQQRSFLPFA